MTDPTNDIPEFPATHNVPRKPKRFQFRLRTLFIVMVIVAVFCALARIPWFLASCGAVIGFALFYAFLAGSLLLPTSSIGLIRMRLLPSSKKGLEFRDWKTLLILSSLHSVVMLMLATVAFGPDWKGSKGEHWSYYLLDAPAGYTLWPIYWIGVISFIVGVVNPEYARRSRLNLAMIVTLVLISAWYSFAALFLSFCPLMFAYIPISVCLEYTLYAWLVVRNRQFHGMGPLAGVAMLAAWIATTVLAIVLKIPLAIRLYERLPASPSPECFIVTAAGRGHGWLVRPWRDDSGRTVNRQLVTFWKFEANLKATAPTLHRALRTLYNAFAPWLARCVVFPWMADVLYVLLKPMEWTVAVVNRIANAGK